jgi:peptide/nickel transport system substrate-binding protein
VLLYPNTKRKPFDDVRVRKALSMAIDRPRITHVAMYDYTRPSDGTALSDAHKHWRNEDAVAAGGWVQFRAEEAERLLDEAGYRRGPEGFRQGPDGKPWHFDVNVVSGWSDWVRAAQLVVQSLRAVGVDAALHGYDFGAFFDKLQRGDFDLSFGWANDGPTPYTFYRGLMATATARPVGEASAENWNRFSNPEVDALLAQFENTANREEQKVLADKLQMIFVEHAPVIPLFPNISWGEYSSAHFQGFPDQSNPYAALSPNERPECLLVLTELKPR